MTEGARVGGRFQLTTRIERREGVERWRGVALDTGDPVEVLVFVGATADRATFADLHGQMARATDPHLVRTMRVWVEDERVLVLREPLEDGTLEALPSPLDAATVARIGASLLPAVLAAGAATRGRLTRTDIGMDARGRPMLAPLLGPINAVTLAATRTVAPEAFADRSPDGAAGLYGLGAILWELSTGQASPTAGTRPGRATPPPPSVVRIGVPSAFDQAVLALMSEQPARRAGALAPLLDQAGPVSDLRPLLRRRSVTGEVKITVGERASGSRRPTEADPAALIIVDAASLIALDPAERSRAAAFTGLSARAVESLGREGLPLVLEAQRGRAGAQARTKEIADQARLPAIRSTRPAVPAVVPLLVGGGLALVPLVIAAVLALIGLLPGAWVALLALLPAGAGVWSSRRIAHRHAQHTAALTARHRAAALLEERSAAGRLDRAWRALAQVRGLLGRADLPTAADADVRAALLELEDRLEGLARVAETAEDARRRIDADGIRARLSALQSHPISDELGRSERDRVARTVGDLDAIDARLDAVEADARWVVDAATEMVAVLGQIGDDVPDDDELMRLDRSARNARKPAPEAPARAAAREQPEPG